MSESGLGPGAQGVVVFAALVTFALVTTAFVVALGVTPVAEAVPESPDAVPDQPDDAVPGVEEAVRGPAANETVSGTVRAPDGSPASNATVVLAPTPAPLFSKATPSELRDVVDAETSDDLYVATTDANGSFAVDVPTDEYDVIALRDENVSAVRTVNATGNASVTLDVVDERPLRYDATGTRTEPGETATVTVRAYNNDADARTFTVAFTDVPDDWTVESFDGTADRVDEGAHEFAFESVESGEWARATLTVRAPANATRGERYRFDAVVTEPTGTPNATAVLRWEGSASVLVPANETASTTPTYAGDDGSAGTTTFGGTTEPSGTAPPTVTQSLTTAGPDPRTEPSPPGNDVPGFGVVVAVASVLAAGALLARRRT
jgi:PGF-CTERM protein